MPTRREIVGGLAIGGAAYVLAGPLRAARAATERECVPNAPGLRADAMAASPDGRTIWVADSGGTTITSFRARDLRRRRSIEVGGAPISVAITPDGERAVVVTAAYDDPGLAIVDLTTREVDRLDVGTAPRAVALSANGRRAYVAGGGAEGTLTRVDLPTGRVHQPIAVGSHPRGLAVDRRGRVLVALNGESAVVVVDDAKRRIARRIATPAFPSQIAIAPDGARALVTHDGFGSRRVTPVDLRRGKALKAIKVGLDPAGVAITRSGARAVVTNSGGGTATVLDARTGRRRRTVRGLGAPRAVAIVAGGRAVVADGPSGHLTVVRLGSPR